MKVVPIKLWVGKLSKNSFRKLSPSIHTLHFSSHCSWQNKENFIERKSSNYIFNNNFFLWGRLWLLNKMNKNISDKKAHSQQSCLSQSQLIDANCYQTKVSLDSTSNLRESRKTDENYRLELSHRSHSVVSVSLFPRIVCAWSKLSRLFHLRVEKKSTEIASQSWEIQE